MTFSEKAVTAVTEVTDQVNSTNFLDKVFSCEKM